MNAKKTVIFAAAALAAATAFAAAPKGGTPAPGNGPRGQKGPDFTNKVYTDIYSITSTTTQQGDGTTKTETTSSLQPIYDQISVELQSGKVDAGLKVTSALGKASEVTGASFSWTSGISTTTDEYYIATGFSLDDWYIEWRPIELLTIGVHDEINIAGSYLPVTDDNIAEGNMGSDAVLCFRPVAGLRACAGLDFTSYFGKENTSPDINIGADYTYGNVCSFGVTARDVANDSRKIGVYGSYTGTKGLIANAGFTSNADAFNSVSGNILNLGVQYIYNNIIGQADLVTNFNSNDKSKYDLFAAATVTYMINKDIKVFLNTTTLQDFAQTDEDGNATTTVNTAIYTLQPGITIGYKENTFKAGVNFKFIGSTTQISFPVYWKYSI